MCLLIASICGDPVSEKICENATRQNGDGFGIAFLSRDRKDVRIIKYRALDPESQAFLIKKAGKRGPYLAHWRYGTAGPKNRKLCHPFRISRGCAMAHNGVMDIDDIPTGESDTSFLAELLVKQGCRTAKDVIEAIGEIPSNHLGGSKYAALQSNGDIYIHNEDAGTREGSVWHSNECGLKGYRTYGGTTVIGGSYYNRKSNVDTLSDYDWDSNDWEKVGDEWVYIGKDAEMVEKYGQKDDVSDEYYYHLKDGQVHQTFYGGKKQGVASLDDEDFLLDTEIDPDTQSILDQLENERISMDV